MVVSMLILFHYDYQPYTVVLVTFRANKRHQSMLVTCFQRTLVAFLWFGNNQTLTTTEDMSFNLKNRGSFKKTFLNSDPCVLHWSGLHKIKVALIKFVTTLDHANIYAGYVIQFALLA